MNRHRGITCMVCRKTNFCGPRYKCLRCYNFDLCCLCYYKGVTSNLHTPDHPMQCIIPKADFELYYGGEPVPTGYQAQSYACPYCDRMGFTNFTLRDHAITDHLDTTFSVLCPVCAASSSSGSDIATDDFAGHLCSAHRYGSTRLSAEPLAPRSSLSSTFENSELPFDNFWPPERDGSVRTRYSRFYRSQDRIGCLPAHLLGISPQFLTEISAQPSGSRFWSSTKANTTLPPSNFLLKYLLTEPPIQNAANEPEFDHGQFVQSLFAPLIRYHNEDP